jgi:hypothetical protein
MEELAIAKQKAKINFDSSQNLADIACLHLAGHMDLVTNIGYTLLPTY